MTQTKTIADAGSIPAGSTINKVCIMVFIFTFLLIAGLEIGSATAQPITDPPDEPAPEEPDICVGCNDKENQPEKPDPDVTIEIHIDPLTGKVRYIIKGVVVE